MIEERLLNAVLHLFALQAARADGEPRAALRQRVLAYLHDHVRVADTETYIGLFDSLAELHADEPEVAVLEQAAAMSDRLDALLHGFERSASVLRFLELAAVAPQASLPCRIATLVGSRLGLSPDDIQRVLRFVGDPAQAAAGGLGRLLGGEPGEVFRARFAALHLPGPGLLLVAPAGGETLRLEGRTLAPGSCHALHPAHVLRDQWGNELHFAQVAAAFAPAEAATADVVLSGEQLELRFPGTDNGLHDVSFREHGGRLVGIMGGSGSGKSTLLSVLNGTLRPDSGRLLLNGRDVYADAAAVRGVFGFVPQDDLLFEELTVFENLYYAARLCLAQLPDEELRRRVHALLAELGQAATAGLKVGSPLSKTISGGQRKRLNVALELIREPTVLFVDEPTSGLSSADSELVMSLLKQQAARGRLVFVVIHQPSSKVLRMFDALWLLDQGGWPIFRGSPLEAVAYFRSRGDLPGAEEAICAGCGSVNPEQLLEIIEERLLDDAGHATEERKVPPAAWHRMFAEYEAARPEPQPQPEPSSAPKTTLHTPGHWGQLRTFLARDLRARLADRTYLAITLLEPPLLGLLLGLVSRGAGGRTFHENENVPAFLFLCVVVALFMGLSVSAEEICRDRRIQQRERFLHLSFWSYVNSKSLYLAMVAAVQTLVYLAVALPIVGLRGFFLPCWLLLFACAFSSCLLGLNVSATFRSAVTIYILIPLLLVPQMLLSGAIVSFDGLIARDSSAREVPRYADLLPSRWGYEALLVEQYGANAFMRPLLEADARLRLAEDDLDFYLPELESRVQSIALLRAQGASEEVLRARLGVLVHELRRVEREERLPVGLDLDTVARPEVFDESTAGRLEAYLARVRQAVFARRREAADEKGAIETRLEAALGREGLESLRSASTNRAVEKLVLNTMELEPVVEAGSALARRTLPIYRQPESRWGEAHFLAGRKRLGPLQLPTFRFDVTVIFLLTLLLYVALVFRLLPRAATAAGAVLARTRRTAGAAVRVTRR